MEPKIEYLVVDTSAFMRELHLQDIGQNIITVQDVIHEITSHRQLRRLVVLPYDLIVKDVFHENISFVSEFAKKTGDYSSLSATDIKVIALTYQLEKEKVGIQHLKDAPITQRLINVRTNQNASRNGAKFSNVEQNNQINDESQKDDEQPSTENGRPQHDCEDTLCDKLETKLSICDKKITNADEVDDILFQSVEDSEQSTSDYSSDDDPWITPNNIENVKKSISSNGNDDDNEERITVACITADFAMQNVLKQIGLQVTAMDGKVIKHLRTFIFRCTTCFKTTSVMTKRFCPKCGHETLRRVAISMDENGQQVLHINSRKPLTARGKRYSMPTPRGGQHARYPILTEDQPIRNRHITKLARATNDPLDPDYIAGYSPFVAKDVNSRSAVLGVKNNRDFKHWMRRNPNEPKRRLK